MIRTVRLSTGISPADTTEYVAEARFLRGFYHFEGKKMWNNFPYVDESVSYANGNLNVPNYANGSLYRYLAEYRCRSFICNE